MEFKCLAIDTASDLPNVAVCHGAAVASREIDGGGRTETIFAHVDDLLAESGLGLANLDCVAVGRGPGSFTGLRVGIAAAQALAYGADLPVCPVSSLALMAYGAARRAGEAHAVAVLDARMGEVYAGSYRVAADDTGMIDADCVVSPAALRLTGEHAFLAAGPGWEAYPELKARFAERIIGMDPGSRPRAVDLLVLGRTAFERGEAVVPSEALPQYLRDRVTS